MAQPGDELLNPHTGQSIRFVSIEGDRITIPAGTSHTFGGHPEQDATVRWEVRPALRTDELFELLFGMADGTRTMPGDGSNPLDEFAAEFQLAQ